MTIKVLSENISKSSDIGQEHGLSLFIQTGDTKILFDTGQGDLFLKNAATMDIDISAPDFCVISHGHYDHGGGLRDLLAHTKDCNIYIKKEAFEDYFSDSGYIGLDKSIAKNPRFSFTDDFVQLASGIFLFSGVIGREHFPSFNKGLYKEDSPDDFVHEQNLVIFEEGKSVLFTGCAHNGIINIIEKFKELWGNPPDYIVGGFHLYNRKTDRTEPIDTIMAIGKFLSDNGKTFFTCHCTGVPGYDLLKEVLSDRIDYIYSGYSFTI